MSILFGGIALLCIFVAIDYRNYAIQLEDHVRYLQKELARQRINQRSE